jgi:hypothetical protein
MSDLFNVNLKVPTDRSACAQWIGKQTPETTALILEKSKFIFTTLKHASLEVGDGSSGITGSLQARNAELQKDLKQSREIVEQLKYHLGETEKNHMREIAERTSVIKADLRAMHELVILEKDEIVQRLQQERDSFRETVHEEERTKFEQVRTQEMRSCDLLVATLQSQVTSLNSRLTEMKESVQLERNHMREDMKGKDEKIKSLEDEGKLILQSCNEKVTSVMSALTGSSQRTGETGESLVRRRMSTLNLGTYTNESKNPSPGYADGTWTYHYTDGSSIPSIHCICEVKNEEELSQKDFDKFCKVDVPAAQLLGKNWGIFISLRRRIAGKASISIERKLGIPVMWISRDESDSMGAEKMVELAFHTVVDLWPIMQETERSFGSTEYALRQVSEHLTLQREDIEKLNKQAVELEKCGQQIVKRACTMRSQHDTMLKGIFTLRNQDPRLYSVDSQEVYNFWESEGVTLKESLREYHAKHGRHAHGLKDLHLVDEVSVMCEAIPQSFKTALDIVKAEIQKDATVRRVQKRKQTV